MTGTSILNFKEKSVNLLNLIVNMLLLLQQRLTKNKLKIVISAWLSLTKKRLVNWVLLMLDT